eukprot:PITA_28989
MNKTIMERARCMRLHVGLTLQFWADVVDTAFYLINRGPSSSLDGGIPEEAWIGKRVNYSFLKTFGCEAFVHINKENRTKLEAKSKKCTFIGYGVSDFGYRFYDYEKHKIIRRRDVIFNENVLYKDQPQEKETGKKNREYTVLEEITKKVMVPENHNDQHLEQQSQQQQAPQTPETEAVQVETRKKWGQAMKEEMDSLAHNQTWDLVRLPAGKTTLQNKWVYKLKKEDGGRKRYKARLVVKGFAQKKGIEFDEIFSPIVKMTSVITILSLVAAEDLHLD